MKLILRYTKDLEEKEIDLTGVLSVEIETEDASRWALSEDETLLNVRAVGKFHRILIEPRVSNDIRLRTI